MTCVHKIFKNMVWGFPHVLFLSDIHFTSISIATYRFIIPTKSYDAPYLKFDINLSSLLDSVLDVLTCSACSRSLRARVVCLLSCQCSNALACLRALHDTCSYTLYGCCGQML